MASRNFGESGFLTLGALEVLREQIACAATRLNKTREEKGIEGYATVYVTELLDGPKPSERKCSFVVMYSDKDDAMYRRVQKIWKAFIRAQSKPVAQLQQKRVARIKRHGQHGDLYLS